jgi:Ser-tRNA(Ala) deacylase AlaX
MPEQDCMTRKVFWENPYQTQLDTSVSSVSGNTLTVASTIFYAFAGGQESDSGTIGGTPVLEARKDGLEIYYTLDDTSGLVVGAPVTMTIDWERRYRLMRLHFAAEIVLQLVYQNVEGIDVTAKIGAHIAEDKSRIDFAYPSSLKPLLPMLADKANALIVADHPITSAFSDAANERRYWEIEGFAREACGGTHLKRTGEVGAITLKRDNIGKGKERIEIYLA